MRTTLTGAATYVTAGVLALSLASAAFTVVDEPDSGWQFGPSAPAAGAVLAASGDNNGNS